MILFPVFLFFFFNREEGKQKTAKFKTDKQTKGLGLYDNHQHLENIYNNQVGCKMLYIVSIV